MMTTTSDFRTVHAHSDEDPERSLHSVPTFSVQGSTPVPNSNDPNFGSEVGGQPNADCVSDVDSVSSDISDGSDLAHGIIYSVANTNRTIKQKKKQNKNKKTKVCGSGTPFNISFVKGAKTKASWLFEALDRIKTRSSGQLRKVGRVDTINLLENTILFIEDLSSSNWSVSHLMCAGIRYLKAFTGKPVSLPVLQVLRNLVNISMNGLTIQGDDPEDNTLDPRTLLGRFTDGIALVQKSTMTKEMGRLISYFVSTATFLKFGIDTEDPKFKRRFGRFLSEIDENVLELSPEFLYQVLKCVCLVYERGIMYLKTGSFMSFLSDNPTYMEWHARTERIIVSERFVHDPMFAVQNGLVEHPYDAFSLVEDTKLAISTGKQLTSMLGVFNRLEISNIQRQLARLHDVVRRLSQLVQGSLNRASPFGVLLSGESERLKTYLTSWIFNTFASVAHSQGLELDANPQSSSYTKNAGDEYWTNFNSSKWCVILDDLAQTDPSRSKEIPENLKNFIHLNNNVPWCPNQAALEDKGMTPMRNLLTIGTTNVKGLHTQLYFADPKAQLRRWNIKVWVELKPEYKNADGSLNRSSLPEDPTLWDVWTFQCYHAVVSGPSGGHKTKVQIVDGELFTDISSFREYFVSTLKEHIQHQRAAVGSLNMMSECSYCTKCHTATNESLCPNCGFANLYKPLEHMRTLPVEGNLFARPPLRQGALVQSGQIEFVGDMDLPVYVPWNGDHLLLYVMWWFFLGLVYSFFFSETFLKLLFRCICGLFRMWHYFCLCLLKLLGFDFFPRTKTRFQQYRSQIYNFIVIHYCNIKIKWTTLRESLYWRVVKYRLSLYSDVIGLTDETSNIYVMASLVGLATSVGCYWYSMRKSDEVQGQAFTAPIPTDQERPTVWHNTDPDLNYGDLAESTKTTGNMNWEKFLTIMRKQIHRGFVHAGDLCRAKMQVIHLMDHVFVTSRHHFLRKLNGKSVDKITILYTAKKGVSNNITLKMSEIKVHYSTTNDLAFLHIPQLPVGVNLSGYLLDQNLPGVVSAKLLRKNNRDTLDVIPVTNVSATSKKINASEFGIVGKFNVYQMRVQQTTENGDCGTPLVTKLDNSGFALLGLHTLRQEMGDIAFSMRITQTDVAEAREALDLKFVVESGAPMLLNPYNVVRLTNMHPKSPFLFFEKGIGKLIGTKVGFRTKHKSRVGHTFIHDAVVEKFREYGLPSPKEFGAPIMTGWKIKRNAIEPTLSSAESFDLDILNKCADSFIADIKRLLPQEEIDLLQPYPREVVVNGCAGVTYVDKLKRNTSAGFPWGKSKKHFLHEVEPTDINPDPVDFCPEVWERFEQMMNNAKQGIRNHPVYTAHFKDEPVSRKKIEANKTRVFCGAPLDFSLLMRTYLLSFVRVLQRNRFLFEAAPGTVASSYEWEELYNHLTSHGKDQIIAGDFTLFDKSMRPQVILIAFRVIREVCSWSKHFSEEDLRAIASIAEDVAFPLVDFFGDLIEFNGSNPSGHVLTVIINSIVNALYMRYCYFLLNPNATCEDFKAFVALITYGDDGDMGVSKLIPWFNHCALQKILAQVGITYTMAEKGAKSVPFIHIDDASFLKRSFRFDEDIKAIVAPLDFQSSCKSLLWHVRKPALSSEFHSVEVLQNFLRESFFWGKEVFHLRRKIVLEIAEKCKLHEFLPLTTSGVMTFESYFTTWTLEHERYMDNNASLRKGQFMITESEENENLYTVQSGSWVSNPGTILSTQIPKDSSSQQHPGSLRLIKPKFRLTMSTPNSPNNPNFQHDLSSSGTNDTSKSTAFEAVPQPVPSLQAEAAVTAEQIVSFQDATPHSSVIFAPLTDNTFSHDAVPHDELEAFLARPVVIKRLDWIEGTAFTKATFDPWQLFFDHPAIKRKIDNYAYIQCNLHLRVLVNASPFYFGAMLLSYKPLPAMSVLEYTHVNSVVSHSQRPHVWVYPQNNQAGDLELPFFYYKNWLKLTSSSDLSAMGQITAEEVVGLTNANGVTGEKINVQILAWATHVNITGPTAKLAVQGGDVFVVQAGDEYEKGVISRPASVLSAIAGRLTSFPIIGPFARATEIGANAVAGIASLFGFSKVPQIDDVKPMKNLPFHSFSTSEIGQPIPKLTLDPKNELTVDGRTVGLNGADEMSICSIVCRESYLSQASWDVSGVEGDLLMMIPISPCLTMQASEPSQTVLHSTPMGFVSQCFKYWRGDLSFRIKAICTQYHKGRLKITWDPEYVAAGGDDTMTTSFTRIVDLSPDLDIEIVVNYLKDYAWRDTVALINGPTVSTSSFPTSAPTDANGVLSVQIMTELTSPDAATPVKLLVFARGSPNLEFMCPTMRLNEQYSNFTVQAGTPECGSSLATGHHVEPDPKTYAVYGGEIVKSIRTLLRRTVEAPPVPFAAYDTSLAVPAAANLVIAQINQTRFPDPPGFDPRGVNSANAPISGTPKPYTFGRMDYFSLLVPMFVGMRGSMDWQFNLDQFGAESSRFDSVLVRRLNEQVKLDGVRPERIFVYGTTFSKTVAGRGGFARDRLLYSKSLTPGAELTNLHTQTGVGAECPHYANSRFYGTAPQRWLIGGDADASAVESIQVEMRAKSTSEASGVFGELNVDRYYSIGSDFTTFFMLCAPTLYRYDNLPTQADLS